MAEVSNNDLALLTVFLARIEYHRRCELADIQSEDRMLCLENILEGYSTIENVGITERLEQALLEET